MITFWSVPTRSIYWCSWGFSAAERSSYVLRIRKLSSRIAKQWLKEERRRNFLWWGGGTNGSTFWVGFWGNAAFSSESFETAGYGALGATFKDYGLSFETVKNISYTRRFALLLGGLPEKQLWWKNDKRPTKSACYMPDGSIKPALEKFMQSNGLAQTT